MKKILLFLIIVIGLLFTNCNKPTFENSIQNPKDFTTIAIQEQPRDTLIVVQSPDNDEIFIVMNEQDLAEYQLRLINNYTKLIPIDMILICIFLCVVLGVFLTVAIIT